MASKKGIVITAAIAVAIIAASSLVWFIPQTNSGSNANSRSFQDTFSSVYSQSNDMATNANATFDEWRLGHISSEVLIANVSQIQKDSANLKDNLVNARPPAEYQKSFSAYESALDSLNTYLSKIKDQVNQTSGSGNATAKSASPDTISAWRDWQRQVDESVGELPVGS